MTRLPASRERSDPGAAAATPPPEADAPASRAHWRRRVVRLAVPIVLANVGVSLAGIADTAVMGRMSAPVYLSATAIGATLFSTLYWAFAFLRMATGGLVAQALGAGETETMRRVSIRALVLGGALGGVLIALREPLLALGLQAMSGTEELHALTADYVRVRVVSAPATLALFALYGTLAGRQAMRSILALQLGQTALNVVLNVVLFTQTELGIRGVAAATAASEYVALAVGLWMLRPVLVRRPAHDGEGAGGGAGESERLVDWLFERAALARLFTIGGNIFVRSLCLTAAYYWLTAAGSRLGVAVLAANAVLLQLVQLCAFGLDGFAQAAETLTGHAVGQRDPVALRAAVRASAELGLVLAALLALAYFALGGAFIDAMTTQADVRALARTWLPWIALAPLVGVWSFLLDGIFIGATCSREMRDGMLVSLAAFVAASVLLVPPLGNHGLWLAYHVLLIVRAATLARWWPRVLAATGPR